ncbi:MAG TPA: hypothetical protein VHI93_02205 [Candidatus Thermoplasmatota archaeon]|nr:hypothetical protein [Candidatus Thermoplasmatota archaeon]
MEETEGTGAPGWVKALALVALLLAAGVVVLHLMGLSPAGH